MSWRYARRPLNSNDKQEPTAQSPSNPHSRQFPPISRFPKSIPKKREDFNVANLFDMPTDGPSISAREAAVEKGRSAFHTQRHKHAIAYFSKVRPAP